MKIKPIVFSFTVSIILSFIFLMAVFWIVYVYSGDSTAIKDALNTTGSYFGGIATLSAAMVAAYLFNDWKDQHNKNIDAQLSMRSYDFIEYANDQLLFIFKFIRDYIDEDNKESLKKEFDENLKKIAFLCDITVIKLADLAYFVDKAEYETIYTRQIEILSSTLNDLLEIHKSLEGEGLPNDKKQEIQITFENLYIDIRNRYRSFVVELKKYYKA